LVCWPLIFSYFAYHGPLAGNGAAWTRLHPVIEVWDVCSLTSPLREDHVTEDLMVRHSIEKVRGGCYSQVNLADETRWMLEKKLQSAKNECFRCGSKDHFVEQCPVELSALSEVGFVEYTCFACGLTGHFAHDCDAFFGRDFEEILPPSRKRRVFSEQEDELESSSSDNFSYGNDCYRCGHAGHWSNECYATYDVTGRRI
jgi:hypothetical protein